MRAKFSFNFRLIWAGFALVLCGTSRLASAQQTSFVELRPVKGMVSAQKLRMLTSHAEFRGGTLAIADYARLSVQERKGQDREWYPYLHIVRVGNRAAATSCASFRVMSGIRVNDPQFSPDGKTLLFKVGDISSSNSGTQLAFWDLKSHRARLGPSNVVYRRVFWSPNSRYLAYAMGGNVDGNASVKQPLELFLYDTKTQTSRLIDRNIGVKWMNWAAPDTLFYTRLSGDQYETATKAAIYSAKASGGAPEMVVSDAIAPLPSRDGRSLVGFGWATFEIDPTSVAGSDKLRGLYRFDLASQKRVPLLPNLASHELAGIHWLRSGKLVYLRETRPSPRAQVTVEVLDARSGATRKVATLDSRDIKPYFPTETEPKFSIVALSPRGDTVFVQVREVIGIDESLLVITSTLRAVNLQSGKVVGGIKYGTVYGLDWTTHSPQP